ncbi:hypothetical protein HPB48_000920 [Haemaphysalis longicornis]|uniref:Uncharacterized protein n=1 Tax=Haemaphysalis longicornis TaxID=44386 RepID=A0A9J6FBK2_HAELO|nr:hypothetical protein HPB48_000920 [Haemaphysalis longicornis]
MFNESGPNALRAIGPKHQLIHYEDTASFMETIVKWWKIVNVKTPFKGARFHDDFKKPVFPSKRDPKLSFLYDFLDWLEYWKEKQADTCKLTKETHGALHQTTQALIEICRYCFDKLHMSFVLLGEFQTDLLENHFGRYRCLAGSQYHVSIRQLYEGETKLRLESTLPQIGTSSERTGSEADEDTHWEDFYKRADVPRPSCNVIVTAQALSKLTDIVAVLAYVAGYAVHIALKRLKCESCKDALTVDTSIAVSATDPMYSLVKDIDTGGLITLQWQR